jgi:hypothetical protein
MALAGWFYLMVAVVAGVAWLTRRPVIMAFPAWIPQRLRPDPPGTSSGTRPGQYGSSCRSTAQRRSPRYGCASPEDWWKWSSPSPIWMPVRPT